MLNEILMAIHALAQPASFHGFVIGDIGTAIGLGGSILGGIMGNQAADTQADAANSATRLQKDMYTQQRSDQMPWLSAGSGAINQLAYLMGVNPQTPYTYPGFAPTTGGGHGDPGTQPNPALGGTNTFTPSTALGGFGSLAHPFGMADYQADPGYAFRLAEGQKALERSQAAKGGLLSGAALKAMDSYSQGMASQEFGQAYDRWNTNNTNLYNRLAGIAGTGQTAANNIGSAGQNAANNIGNNMMSAGNARSAGQVNMGNMLQTGLGYLGNSFSSPWSQNGGLGPSGGFSSGGIDWGPLYGG